MRFFSFFVLLMLLPVTCRGQAIDNTLSYKDLGCNRYFRISYENDFFTATDIYYTQGINLEMVASGLSKFPLAKLLLRPAYGEIKYGIGLEHAGYTPTSLGSDAILYGDRPFTATLLLKTFSIATDSVYKQRFSTTLSTGIMGPDAGGQQMQTDIHRWLHNIIPRGWENQLHNDAALNYQVDYEKLVASYGNLFSADVSAIGRAGTLSDKASLGGTLMLGYFDSPYSGKEEYRSHFRLYVYEHPEVDAVGFDATLQGGLLNKTSPYTIPAAQVTRFTLQNRAGFVISWQRVYLEYFLTQLTREFSTGKPHAWGGVQIAFGL